MTVVGRVVDVAIVGGEEDDRFRDGLGKGNYGYDWSQ